MVKFSNFILKILMLTKALCLSLACLYLACWFLPIISSRLFSIINNYLGFIPNFIDNIYLVEINIKNVALTMGYVYTSILFLILTYFFHILQKNILNKIDKKIITQKTSIPNTEEIIEKKEIKQTKIEKNKKAYFGLLELSFQNLDENNQDENQFQKLKKEYSRMLVDKLNYKYPEVTFASLDKVFFMLDDIKKLDDFILDILDMFKVFVEIDKTKKIATNLLLSFVSGLKEKSPKYYCALLYKINALKYFNKIIVTDDLAFDYQKLKTNIFNVLYLNEARIDLNSKNKITLKLSYFKPLLPNGTTQKSSPKTPLE